MAVFRPLQVRTTEKRTSVVIVVIWIISMAVSSPFLIVKKQILVEVSCFIRFRNKFDFILFLSVKKSAVVMFDSKKRFLR